MDAKQAVEIPNKPFQQFFKGPIMKNLITVITVTAALLAAPIVSAVDEHHPDQKPAAAPATPKDAKSKEAMTPAAKDGGMPMGMMQDNMLKMHEQMHKIMQAKDPKQRDKLMQEHMQMMQEHMKTMGGMMGPGMMGEQMMQRMQQMEKRMDTMQMMLEQTRKP
jgi:hypothetical protein